MSPMIRPVPVALLALLGACGDGLSENSGVTAEESLALDEAEAMLDEPSGSGGNGANGS